VSLASPEKKQISVAIPGLIWKSRGSIVFRTLEVLTTVGISIFVVFVKVVRMLKYAQAMLT
jgi:hypothetical protein